MTYPPLRLEGLPFELEWDPLPNYTIGSSNSFEWRKIIFRMITSMGIRHVKAYTLRGRSLMKLGKSERPPVITIVFAATTPENMPFAYRASTLAIPNPMINTAFVEANYEDEEREMEPRPEPNSEATPTFRPRSPVVRRQRERVVKFEEAPNREGSRRGSNAEGIWPWEIEAREDEYMGVNHPPLLVAHMGRNESGLHEEQRISGCVHGLRIRSLVEHLSTDLPSTYKGLMEKTYTWIEAREVATNRIPNDRRENFERSRKSSWDNNRGQKEKAARSFEQPPRMFGRRRSRDMSKYCHFHKDHGHDTNECRQLRNQIKEAVKSGQLSHLVIGIKKERDESYTKNKFEGLTSEGKEITFPLRGTNSSAPVVIKSKIFGREVNRVQMDSGSSYEIIYEHYFMKLKPSIKASKVDSKVPLIGFLGEKSLSIRKIPLEITIHDAPLTRKETLSFMIVKSDSPYNMLLGRTTMQKMGIMVSTIHGAIKFHTTKGIGIVFLTHESDKVKE
ncbi:reverse transcriptase domain-containing protein [Tanacetum coccineum]|uniref:Reverse transcriptase domain-containing protein n=1 Tax=Tanacetum coccineum TaxID=301880 RepID=A0ABQ5EKS4_9ASTR